MFNTLFRAINKWLHALILRKPTSIPTLKMDVPSGDNNSVLVAAQKINQDFNAIVKSQDKDLNDLTETPNCGPWNVTRYHCQDCDKTLDYDGFMQGFCKFCGTFGHKGLNDRSWRKVLHEGQWKFQLRYKNGHSKIVDKLP